MLNAKDLKEFQENYCTTLIPDTTTKGYFVKIPVANYSEVNIIRTNLISAIDIINRYHELSKHSDRGDIVYSVGTIIQLLRCFEMEEECDGLNDFMK